jgi:hypothetical protein
MLGAAKPDFETHAVDCTSKQFAQIERRRAVEVKRQLRQ